MVSATNGIAAHDVIAIASDPLSWTSREVEAWLNSGGFERYAKLLAYEHRIDGATLLTLNETDLREKPLQLTCLGDIKRLAASIHKLRETSAFGNELTARITPASVQTASQESYVPSYSRVNGYANGDGKAGAACSTHAEHTDSANCKALLVSSQETVTTVISSDDQGPVRLISRDEIIRQVEAPDTHAKSVLKLAIAFSYCLLSLLITAFVMVLVHDRVPDMKMYPPLPDIVLDNLPLIPWAFDMCEMIGVTLATIWLTVLIFHKHRVVIARRMFSLVGTVFLLRCITMMITSLSVPGVHLECRAKNHGSLAEKVVQAFQIWSKLGMSIQGVRTCGDYMFSGHTTAITLLNHFITEYTPNSWSGLHTVTWVCNLFGVFFILAGHEHYSIDVFVAFYISSRMFLYYHTFAYNHANLTATDDRMRIWFPLGWFFEAGSIGKVPNEFEFPFKLHWRRAKSKEEKEPGVVSFEASGVLPPARDASTIRHSSTRQTNGTARDKRNKKRN